MELSPKQQIVETIKKAENILLVSHAKPSGDSVGSLLAFSNVLKGIGKNVRVVVSDDIPESLGFLPNISNIEKDIDKARDLVFKIDVEGISVEKISTKTDGKTLEISITPKRGELNKEKTVITEGRFKYDAIVVLDTPDIDNIDKIYNENTDVFLETPIINIDHHAGNEYFGTVNLVDLTATSTAEILVAISEALGKNKSDEDTATLLLAGIMSDTESFRGDNTTPKSLTVSAQLLASGARKKEIVENLYKKEFHTETVEVKAVEKGDKKEITKSEEPEKVKESESDIISKAIESLEAAEKSADESSGEKVAEEEVTEEKKISKVETSIDSKSEETDSGIKVHYETSSLMPISEILKKFSPKDAEKIEEYRKKNELAREKLKEEKKA